MTTQDRFVDNWTGDIVRSRLRATAQEIPVPDIWTGLSKRMASEKTDTRLRLRTPKWLAPAGTVLVLVAAIALWVVLINGGEDEAPVAESPDQTVDGSTQELTGLGTPADETEFMSVFDRLETAGPFKVQAELSTTSRHRGSVSTLPAAMSAGLLDSQEFRSLFMNNGFTELECVEHGLDRACLLGVDDEKAAEFIVECTSTTARPAGMCGDGSIPVHPVFISGTPIATLRVVGGTHRFESLYLNSDLYRIERTLEIDPEFKGEVAARIPVVDLSEPERTARLQQQNGRYFDSSSPAPGGYGYINVGSAEAFVIAHINPFLTEPPPATLGDFLQFEDIRLVSPGYPNGSLHYRASISGTIGESGTWDMWVGEDGLPLKIMIEVFTSPQWRGSQEGETETTRAELTFFDFGETVDSDDPLLRLQQR